MKIKLFDKKLNKNYLAVISIINLILSFCLIVIKIPDNKCARLTIGIVIVLLLITIYLIMWRKANTIVERKFTINNSTMVVKIGDIFKEEELKVIAFNEYFDTTVDNNIISENSLNGIYINSIVKDVEGLDNRIDSDPKLTRKIVDVNQNRDAGKKKKYKLGTIFENDNYLLTAFTKFDDDNRACLTMEEYIQFIINFWNEVDILYAGRSVSIPLLGTGITRFKGYDTISEQELLELLIWSFKISRIKFAYPSKVSIIVHESIKDKVNFYKLERS